MKTIRPVLIRIQREAANAPETWRIEYQLPEPVRAIRFATNAVLDPASRLVSAHPDLLLEAEGGHALAFHRTGDHFSHARFTLKVFPRANLATPTSPLLSIPEAG